MIWQRSGGSIWSSRLKYAEKLVKWVLKLPLLQNPLILIICFQIQRMYFDAELDLDSKFAINHGLKLWFDWVMDNQRQLKST